MGRNKETVMVMLASMTTVISKPQAMNGSRVSRRPALAV